MSELTVGAGLPRGLVRLAVAKGARADELWARSGIDPADLGDQDNRVPMPKYVALMRAAKELTNDPALGLHYGEAVDLGEVSITGLIANASETMGDAFIQLNRFGRLAIEVDASGWFTMHNYPIDYDGEHEVMMLRRAAEVARGWLTAHLPHNRSDATGEVGPADKSALGAA
jgi:hypothetical protein